MSEGAAQDPRFQFFHELPEDKYEAFLSVPLLCRGRVVGVINLQHRQHHVYRHRERSVDPSRERPANSPRDRDHDKISASIRMSVLALVSRPTGPAAASASPPIVNLSDSSFFIPPSFLISHEHVRGRPAYLQTVTSALNPNRSGRAEATPCRFAAGDKASTVLTTNDKCRRNSTVVVFATSSSDWPIFVPMYPADQCCCGKGGSLCRQNL